MQHYDDRIWVLITKELSGEASPEERRELRRWLSEDPDHQSFYNEIERDWKRVPENTREVGNTPYLFDYESGLSRLLEKIKKEGEPKGNPDIPIYVRSGKGRAWKIAASVLLLVISLSVYLTTKHWNPPVTTYTATQMEQRIITLPDGSKVRLNRGSTLSFAKDLAGERREITFRGEAFFDITKNPDRPFVIYSNDAEIRVLGTTFNVKNFGTDRVERLMVAVKEGTVSVLGQTGGEAKPAVKISAGHLGVLSGKNNEVKVEEADIENYLGWMTGHLAFDGMPFHKVARQLERIYEIECVLYDPDINELRLTVQTRRLQKNKVLKNIARALNLTYREDGNKVIWRMKQGK